MIECVDEDTRTALRELARQAEWGVPQGGYDLEAARLRELGQALARRIDSGPQYQQPTGWAHRAVAELAEHCRTASADWSPEAVVTLARLREDALIALAPPPGQPDGASTSQTSKTPRRPSPRLQLPRGRRAAAIGLAVIGCCVIAGIVVAGTGGHHAAPAASSTTAASQPSASLPDATPTATSPLPTATTSPTAAASVPSSASTTPTSAITSTSATTSPSTATTAHVTAIQMTAAAADDYPEVQLYGTITASGTGDVTVTITVAGASGAPQITTEDESGQLSYALSQTVYLQQWCGQKSVTITVASGSVSKSSTAAVSGC